MLFLFYNADLVERKILNREGVIAFVNNYTEWVVGENAEANTVSLRKVINHALAWEACSGAIFKGEKTALVHFTRNPKLRSNKPLNIKGADIQPQNETKILGVVMDSKLRYKNHVKRISNKGLKAALALKQMRALSPPTARQLFIATVAPVINYASSI